MDKLIHRLKYYLIGFGLGCVMVYAIFYTGDDARASWLPKGRILEFIAETPLTLTEKSSCLLSCNQIDAAELDEEFFLSTSVKFKESNTKREPCPEYKLIGKLKSGKKVVVFIEACEPRRLSTAEEKEGVATLLDIYFEENPLTCDCK